MLALRALRQAVQLDPDNRDIRNAYDKLHKDVTIQQEKDKLRFKGFLLVNRGHDGRLSSADDTLNIPHQQPSMSVAEAYTQLQDMESAAARHYDSGLLAESAELRETVNRIRGEIDQYVHSQKKSRAGSRCSQVSQR